MGSFFENIGIKDILRAPSAIILLKIFGNFKAMKKESTENFDLDILLEKINALSIYESNGRGIDNDPEVTHSLTEV